MAVIATNEWLEAEIADPVKMCQRAMPDVSDSEDFYHYLKQFGIYQSENKAKETFEKLQKQNVWEKVDKYYQLYRKKWQGPKVDIYIFPLNEANSFFKHGLKGRAGISMPHKIFLFLTEALDEKYWESLFIHEYHHAARMIRNNKSTEDYTLLDSLVFEGLAEQTALLYCGEEYSMSWQKKFTERELRYYWQRYYKPNLTLKKKDRMHDDLLFGRKRIPQMMGYAQGVNLVNGYLDNNKLTVTESLRISSDQLLIENSFIDGKEFK
ncbi:DUF2268 domain-containing putative Zn-dependent protease [Lederbergia lenta]|uniref:YjaZ n=1 Tax=Lederbergia lenta TaxID=1467 RepID=A0A2X4WTC4_LEDLE|nr:DUF2268 domain-containing putative Zn-dependent protease [Lederbergia lenta]MCM3110458.1 DUF2268 domain-containing protein [Lederbergia lenta]MEC2323976.1 DUF2268 domain-containing putative Zn-dependent protease [Lederbergia lenta]SQI60880.1 YjaZ [Lederbergia lenta]